MKLNFGETGICPVCNGTCTVTITRPVWDSKTRNRVNTPTIVPCTNCGGQYMFGTPRGNVPLNKQGQPCKHSYTQPGPGYRSSTYSVTYCEHCDDPLSIDSGD